MTKKRYIWIWISQNASDVEIQCWQQFIKVNMSVSENVRFLTAESEEEYLLKQDVLEKADGKLVDGAKAGWNGLCISRKSEQNEQTTL